MVDQLKSAYGVSPCSNVLRFVFRLANKLRYFAGQMVRRVILDYASHFTVADDISHAADVVSYYGRAAGEGFQSDHAEAFIV